MKKVLCLLTAAALLLTLCACGAEEAPSEAEYYWRAETESLYPLGLNGVIQALPCFCGRRGAEEHPGDRGRRLLSEKPAQHLSL